METITRKHPITGEEIVGHLHPNGGGFVADTAQVDDSAHVSGQAMVCGTTKIPQGWNGATFACNSFTATVNEGFIQIGCHAKPAEEWLKVTEDEASDMGLPKIFYPAYKAFIQMVVDFEGKDD